MSRFFMFGHLKRASKSFLKSQISHPGLRKHGADAMPFMPQHILFSSFRSFHKEYMPIHKMKLSTTKREFSRSYSAVYASNSMACHAQNTWRRLSKIYLCNSTTVSPIGRFAQAFCLASTRSHLVVSGLFGLIFGELALSQTTCAESSYYPSKNTVYMHAEDGHAYMSNLLFAVLEVLILLLRTFHLAILFSPSIAMAPFADSFGVEFRRSWLHIVRQTLEQAGPAFIKWGQWAATRPDLFPADLCAELSKLHSNAPEHSFAYTKRTVEKAFGRKLPEIFERFEEIPIASGSIAQVHRASLRFRYPGKRTAKIVDVAVKVRHPGVGDSIRRDFVIINAVAKISNLIPTLRWLRLDESVQQFAVFMISQVDLSREAAHLSRFIYNFRNWRDVSFPKPLYPLVHPAVLVETFEQGQSVAHFIDDSERHERFKTALAHIGTHALLKMLLVDNFIHADMHPGNILVRDAHKKLRQKRKGNSRPHVVFIDVGMTAELSKNDRVNLIEFFKAVACRDGQTAAECTLRLSKKQNCPNPDAFIKEVKESFDFWGTPEGDLVHPADCMHQLLEKVRRHRVNIDGNVCTVIVTTLVLEGWQRKLDPDYDVMHTLQTLLFKEDWAKSISYTIEGLMAP